MKVKKLSNKHYKVCSSSGKWYDVFVDRGKASCTCSDFVFRGMYRPCKHIKVVLNVSSK